MKINRKNIFLLTDYRGTFGSKEFSRFYRSGMDIELIQTLFKSHGYNTKVVEFSAFDPCTPEVVGSIVLYTSYEDSDDIYKSYIEDIILACQLSGAICIPEFNYLRAHENKVFMELLRRLKLSDLVINTKLFSTFEEGSRFCENIEYPVVVKGATGSLSKNVFAVNNQKELLRKLKTFFPKRHIWFYIKEFLRRIKYPGYKPASGYIRKYIVQQKLRNVGYDYKIILYDNNAYLLKRFVRKNDFRSSGSGNFTFLGIENPRRLLDFARSVQQSFKVPFISLDVLDSGDQIFLLEFQFIYFGTKAIELSPFHYQKVKDDWVKVEEKVALEKLFVDSIVAYLENYI